MTEQKQFKNKDQMIEAIKDADQIYLLTQKGDEQPLSHILLNDNSTASTLAFVVLNFIASTRLMINADEAVSIATNWRVSALPADLVKEMKLISTRVKLHFYNERKTEADDE